MWIKICGTTSLADALLAIEHGADALGFIFAPSKRQVTVEQAAAMAAHLPPHVERVGIFTTADVPGILQTIAQVGLTAVQLHRPHDPAFTAELSQKLAGQTRGQIRGQIRLIQVVGVSPNPVPETASLQANIARIRSAFADAALWAVLLDTEKDGRSGGLGVPFSWNFLQPALQEGTASQIASRPKLLLAGGLDAANVAEAIQTLRPWGVDCVSGVEAGPGRKDPVRLAGFIQAARQAG